MENLTQEDIFAKINGPNISQIFNLERNFSSMLSDITYDENGKIIGNTENPAYSAHLLTVPLLKFPRYCAHLAKIRDTRINILIIVFLIKIP